ncbi:MAG: mobilization protein [Sulfitobacter sp.]
MADTELERAEKRFAQAKARLQGIRNREATKQRKMDTRRKVILGGALIDLAGRDNNAAAMLDRLVRNLPRQQDQKAFLNWDGPVSDTSPAPPEADSDTSS